MPLFLMACSQQVTISKDTLKDKIAGGWAGKMIGVSYTDSLPNSKRWARCMKNSIPLDSRPSKKMLCGKTTCMYS